MHFQSSVQKEGFVLLDEEPPPPEWAVEHELVSNDRQSAAHARVPESNPCVMQVSPARSVPSHVSPASVILFPQKGLLLS